MSLHFKLPAANVTSALRLSKRISTGVSSCVSAFLSSVAGFFGKMNDTGSSLVMLSILFLTSLCPSLATIANASWLRSK